MTELLVGTKKGLFVLEGEPGRASSRSTARAFAGEPVEYAMRDPRSGRVLATVTSPFYGPKIFYADDPAGEWEQADGVALPEGGDAALERIWVIVPGEADGRAVRGRRPRRAVREPRRRRHAGSSTAALWEHPTRPKWQPGGGGLCLHSIVPVAGRARPAGASAISAAGVWLTEDGGAHVAPAATRASSRATCPRTRREDDDRAVRAPPATARRRGPSGCSCSSTAACTAPTTRARAGATSARACRRTSASRWRVDPADPDSAYVIPLVADMDRVTPEGRVRVYETRDAGDELGAARRRPARRRTPT